MHAKISFVCIVVSLCSVTVLQAAPPKVTSLFPAGVQRGHQVEIKLNGSVGTLPLKAWCESDLVTITVAEDDKTATIEAKETTPQGLVGVRFYNEEGSTEMLPVAIGVLPEFNENEPNDALTSEQKFEVPCIMNGTLSKSGEVDTFAVSLKQGQELIASVDANRLLGSPMDAVLQVLSPLGFVVAQNDDDHGVDPLISFSAEETGIHYVRLFAFPSAPNSTINYAGSTDYVYRLTMTTEVFVHHAIRGQLDGTASASGWKLPATKTSPQELAALPGLHLLSQSEAPVENQKLEQPLNLPATIHSRVTQIGQRDMFSLKTNKGTSYNFEVRARRLGSQLDPVLQILNADGKLLKESDDIARDNQDVTLAWKAPSDETVQIESFDRYSFASPSHFYELEVSEVAPAFTLTTSADHYIVKAKESVEIEVKVNRVGGHKSDIVITAEQLPDGVTAEPVTSSAKGDNAKSVKLKLTASETAAISGPILLQGISGGDQPHKAVVTAPLKGALKNSSLWLTVTPLETP